MSEDPKALGNDAFRSGEYEKAIEHYTKAIDAKVPLLVHHAAGVGVVVCSVDGLWGSLDFTGAARAVGGPAISCSSGFSLLLQ